MSQYHTPVTELPLVLAGPILRHTTPEAVTVWVALQQACEVELKIYSTTNEGQQIGECWLEGNRSTVSLGQFLHVVAVTARSPVGAVLQSDRIYAYDLHFTHAQGQCWLEQATVSNRFPSANLSYFAHQKPTFVLPPAHLEDLQLVHGSCRKPHGHGLDAFPILDSLLEETAHQPRHRPHQLFLTGDQIYGDDVAAPFLGVASLLGDALLGWQEKLPIGRREPDDITYCVPSDLPPGQRAEIATTQAGFTAGLRDKRMKATSHLFSLGEYYAAYLLAWSPVCWAMPIPQGHRVRRHRRAIRQWNQELQEIDQFVYTLWRVRRALANLPTYMIFDDHDVSDDWNLNRAWCLRVLGRPLGRRVVQNALLAYAVFQAWGNTPDQFEGGQSGEKLLDAAQNWSTSQGRDRNADQAIARYTGMPIRDSSTGLPQFVQDDSVLILDRHPDALTWHYTVRSQCHEVIVLDTRTWRGYLPDESAIAPPMLLSSTAFEQQLSIPLRQENSSALQATFFVAPTNLFNLKVIDWIHHWQLRNKKVFSTDVGDAWNMNTDALAQLLTQLFEHRQSIIALSGDIHYSSTIRLSYRKKSSPVEASSVLVQLTCSAMKNEELLTRILHTRLKDWLLPESVRHWMGWSRPPQMLEISSRHRRSSLHQPDWVCTTEWMPRQAAQRPPFNVNRSWLAQATQSDKRIGRQASLRFCLKFWKWKWFQDGREIVGVNNLAVVSFLSTSAGSPPTVVHMLYWFSPWYPIQIVYSRYDCKLIPKIKSF